MVKKSQMITKKKSKTRDRARLRNAPKTATKSKAIRFRVKRFFKKHLAGKGWRKLDSFTFIVFIAYPLLMLPWLIFKNHTAEYDFFLLDNRDFKQGLKWYAHDWAWYLTSVLKSFVLFFIVRKHYNTKSTIMAFIVLVIANWRLLEYTLFHHRLPVPFFVVVAILILTLLYILNRRSN